MQYAHNPDTGEVFKLNGDAWEKVPSARGKGGEVFALEGDGWKAVASATKPPEKKAGFMDSLRAQDWRGVAQATGSALGGGAALVLGNLGPQAAVPEEAVTVPAAMAAGDAMGGAAYDYVRGLFTPEEMPTVPQQVSRAATDAGLNVVGEKVLGPVFQAVGNTAKSAFSPIKTYAKKRVGPVGARSASQIAEMEAQGFRPEVGMLDSPEAQAFSQSLRGKPGTGSIMGEVDAHNYARAQDVNQSIADKLGPDLDSYSIGQSIRSDADAARSSWRDVNKTLWDRVAAYVPDGVPIAADNIVAAALGVKNEAAQSPYLADALAPSLRQAELVLSSVKDGHISKAALDSIKKAARGSYKKLAHEADDVDRLRMAFERAADKDIAAAALRNGGDDAAQDIAMAKDWYKRGRGDKKMGDVGLLDEAAGILKNPEPAAIYNRLMNGGKPAVESLMKTFNMLSPETASAVRSRAYRDLGRATPGNQGAAGDTFSFSTFLTNYNKMQQASPGAADILFGPAKKEMDGLLKNAEFFKSLDKYANSSKTAQSAAWDELWRPILNTAGTGAVFGGAGGMSVSGAVQGAVAGTALQAARLGTQRRIARLMTNPDFVKWLADGTNKAASVPSEIPQHLGRLALMALAGDTARETSDDFLWYLSEATGRPVNRPQQ
jgi:hypothetical protein